RRNHADDIDVAPSLLDAAVHILGPHLEPLGIVRLAAEAGKSEEECSGVCGQDRQEEDAKQNLFHTTPHFLRSSHSLARNARASRKISGMSHRSRVSRVVMPASEYEISFDNLDASDGV